MTRKNKKYDLDFKFEAAKLVVEHGYSCAEASRDLGLPIIWWGAGSRRFGNQGNYLRWVSRLLLRMI
jgi:transposase-like protein